MATDRLLLDRRGTPRDANGTVVCAGRTTHGKRGERFVYQTLPREEFNAIVAMVERWGLDDFMKERRMERLVYAGAPI